MTTAAARALRGSHLLLALVLSLTPSAMAPALAQSGGSLFTSPPPVPPNSIPQGATGSLPGAAGLPGASLVSPGGGVSAPASVPPMGAPGGGAGTAVAPIPHVPPGQVALYPTARFGRDAPAISHGVVWRVYADKPDQTGVFRLLKEDKSATPMFVLPPGGYIVHGSFGLASAVKPVTLRGETVRESFEIPAGGLRIEGRVGDVRIPAGQISFDIFKGSQFEPGEKRPFANNVMTGDVVLVPEGTYYIVSNYGDANATVRSDIRVQPAKLTDVSVTHRAAIITMKLVSERGGEALANTQWSVLTPGGDVIKESIGAFPRVVLAEGEYRAIARNEGKVFERGFKVITGVDGEIEVLAR
jgi:hypothetical protein